MKRLTLMSALVAAFITGYSGSATAADDNTDARVRLTRGSENTFVLDYLKEGTNRVWVQIVDERGTVVFGDHIRNPKGFKQPFNFAGMEEGRYMFRIEDRDGVITETVEHSASVDLPDAKLKKIDDERYELSVVGNDIGSVYTYVYDRYGKLLHDDVIERRGNFKKVYNLSKVDNFGAVFEVYSRGKQLIAVTY